MDIQCNRTGVLFQIHFWDQSHITIVWNTRETGDINLTFVTSTLLLIFSHQVVKSSFNKVSITHQLQNLSDKTWASGKKIPTTFWNNKFESKNTFWNFAMATVKEIMKLSKLWKQIRLNVTPLTRRGCNFFSLKYFFCSLLELNALFILLTWNYCLLALPRYKKGNKGSNFKEGGQTRHSIQEGSNQLLLCWE